MRGVLFQFVLAVLLRNVMGCGSRPSTPSSDGGQSGGAVGESSALGFETPEAALEAYGQALVDGDGAAFRKIAVKNDKAIQGLDAILQFEKDMSPEEAAKINLQAMAPIQGFGKAVAKRFPPEVTGDNAVIVQVFERQIALKTEVHFRKFKFSKSGGKWYLVDSEFGEASELPANYAWNNEAPPEVVESSVDTPMPSTPKTEPSASDNEPVVGSNKSWFADKSGRCCIASPEIGMNSRPSSPSETST